MEQANHPNGDEATRGRLLFASYHAYLDPSSGAAAATRDLWEMLTARGWDARALSGPRLDFQPGASWPQLLADQGLRADCRRCEDGSAPFRVYHCRRGGVPIGVYVPERVATREPATAEGAAFLSLYEELLARFRPHVVLTYGGQWLAGEIITRARRQGAAVVFALHNLSYRDRRIFRDVNAVLVPSRFCAEHYRAALGLKCAAIPSPLRWNRIRCAAKGPQYVTFINPQWAKGALVVARIAAELNQRRPDIPLLIVEGRGQSSGLARAGLGLERLSNLYTMANTPDPRDYLRASRMLLMPSLCAETFGRAAAEAMLNSIPVLASRRGALPEVLGGAGFLLDLPPRCTPESREAPTAEEVAPWVETIIRLWDDTSFHATAARRCRVAARRWRPERQTRQYETFFEGLLARAGIPAD